MKRSAIDRAIDELTAKRNVLDLAIEELQAQQRSTTRKPRRVKKAEPKAESDAA